MKKIYTILFTFLLFISGSFHSCSLSNGSDGGLYDLEDFDFALLTSYKNLRAYTDAYFHLSEFSTDELIIPPGSSSDPSGEFKSLHEHTWQPDDQVILNFWNNTYIGIQNVNQALFIAQEIPTQVSSEQKAIARSLRAYYYYLLVDILGNVPLVTEDASPDNPAEQKSRKEIYNFIEQELTQVAEEVPISPGYGHFNRDAVYALLAKLYLNAEVFSGNPQWEKCIAACDKVILAARNHLNEQFYNTFEARNSENGLGEIIFPAIFFAGESGFVMDFARRTIHPAMYNPLFPSVTDYPNWATTAEFFQLFDIDNDLRGASFFHGPQLDEEGNPLNDQNGDPIIYSVEMQEDNPLMSGVRVVKYPPDQSNLFSGGNDFILLRYADVILTKAEAFNEMGDLSGAVTLINQVRARAYEPDRPLMAGDFDKESLRDQILKERANEFFWEGFRRQDLIRHGKFCEVRPTKPADDDCVKRSLYPIPQAAIEQDQSLQQNPGY